jgi:hypothetical protein
MLRSLSMFTENRSLDLDLINATINPHSLIKLKRHKRQASISLTRKLAQKHWPPLVRSRAPEDHPTQMTELSDLTMHFPDPSLKFSHVSFSNSDVLTVHP